MMNFATKFLLGLALAVALTNTAFANTYNLVDTLDAIKFDFTLTTSGDATSSAQIVTAISGELNGANIIGFGNKLLTDKKFKFSANNPLEWFSSVGFSIDTYGEQWLFYSGNVSSDWHFGTTYNKAIATDTTPASPSPTAAEAVPEPEVYAMILAGLGLVGFAARRKQKAAG